MMAARIEQMGSFHKSRHRETKVKKDHTGTFALRRTPLEYWQVMRTWSTMKEEDLHGGIFQLDPKDE